MSQSHPPRSAIIGAGMVGSVHAHAVRRAGGQLVAVSASTPRSGQRSAAPVLDPRSARYSLLPAGHPQGYQDCFNLFVADVYDAIRTGAAPVGLPVFADGLRAATIHAAVASSVSSGGWTDV